MKTILIIITAASAILFSACTPTAGGGSGSVPAPEVTDLSSIPVGRPHPTGQKNLVISPYRPYNLIDVKGYRSGEVVGDPSTAKRDASGKVIESTSKYFLVP